MVEIEIGGVIVGIERIPFYDYKRYSTIEETLPVSLTSMSYLKSISSYLFPNFNRFGISRFSRLYTVQSRKRTIDVSETYIKTHRSPIEDIIRNVLIDVPILGLIETLSYLYADESYLFPEFRRFGASKYSRPETIQTKYAFVNVDETFIDATRTFTGAPRDVNINISIEDLISAISYLNALPSHLFPGYNRFGASRYSNIGSIQAKYTTTNTLEIYFDASRTPFIATDRFTTFIGEIGYFDTNSYIIPDVSCGIEALFGHASCVTDKIKFKRGSTLPFYIIRLIRFGDPNNHLTLTGAIVRLVAKSKTNWESIIDTQLEIVNPLTGTCKYVRNVDDYQKEVDCHFEIIVIFGDGSVLIIPPIGYYSLFIEESLI